MAVAGLNTTSTAAATADILDGLADIYAPVYSVAGTAVGDGSTDDRAAIQAMINACSTAGGGIVTGDRTKTYALAATLVPKDNVTLVGLTLKPTYAGYAVSNSGQTSTLSNFSIDDCTFLGTVNQTVTAPQRSRTTSGTGCTTPVFIQGSLDQRGSYPVVTNITIRNSRMRNCTSLPFILSGITGITRVTNCEFTNCMDAGFLWNQEVIISGCHSYMSADNGISISRGNKKITCVNNTVELSCYHGIWVSGFDTYTGPDDFSVVGNTVYDSGLNCIVLQDAPTNGVVSGNMLDQNYRRGDVASPSDFATCGIRILGYPAATPSSPSSYAKGLLITGNTIRRAARNGISFAGLQNAKISNNLIIDTGASTYSDGSPTGAASTVHGMGILSEYPDTCSNIFIENNLILDTRGTPYQNRGVYPLTPPDSHFYFNNRDQNSRNTSTQPGPLDTAKAGYVTGGQANMSRFHALSTNITMTSGAVRFAYIQAERTDVITKIRMSTSNTAAGATPTLVKYGLYTIASNGDLTQVAVTANTTATFAAANTDYEVALTGSYTVYAGQTYVVAAIVVTGATAPTVTGSLAATATENARSPKLSGTMLAQSDLSSTYVAANPAASQSCIYVVLVP